MAFFIDLTPENNPYHYRFPAAFCKASDIRSNIKLGTLRVSCECYGSNEVNWKDDAPIVTFIHNLDLNLFPCINVEEVEEYIKATYYPDSQEGDADSIYGCMDPEAYNYNEEATVDDGSCVGIPEPGGVQYYTLNTCECVPDYIDYPPIRLDEGGYGFLMGVGGEAGDFFCLGTNDGKVPICYVVIEYGILDEIPQGYMSDEEFAAYVESEGISGPYIPTDEQPDGCEVCCAINYPEDETINFVFNQQPDLSNYIVTIQSALGNELLADYFNVDLIDSENTFENALPGEMLPEESWTFTVTPTNVNCITPDGSTFSPGSDSPLELFTFTLPTPDLLTAEELDTIISFSEGEEYPTNNIVFPYVEPVEGNEYNLFFGDSYGDGGEEGVAMVVNFPYEIDGENYLTMGDPYTIPLSSATQPVDAENFVPLELLGSGGETQLVCDEECTATEGTFIQPSEIFPGSNLICLAIHVDTWPSEASFKFITPDGNSFCGQSGGTSLECENEIIQELNNGWQHFYFLVSENGGLEGVWNINGAPFEIS